MNLPPGTEGIRLRRPQAADAKPPDPPKKRHQGILQDQTRRHMRAPWCPSLSLAFRILLLVRFSAAMYSNIQDCDEVFNFWEPLHYLDKGHGFQTWEVSPVYAIRSWAYILLHLPIMKLVVAILGLSKRQTFFTVRILLGTLSAFSEALFFRAVVDKIHERVGRYMLFMLMFSAGMWNAAPAFLPSSFAMCANTVALAFFVDPPSASKYRRTLKATLAFATGAIVGWPFALAMAFPFVYEELFVPAIDRFQPQERMSWMMARWSRLITAGLTAALIFIPVIGVDSLAYGRLTVVPWNIISYNIFGGSERGPELYGTEPWSFYFLNLLLNFNLVLPLALISLPALGLTYFVDRKRLGGANAGSSPYTVLGIRLAPLYVWLGILTAQAHKEERFMYPAYTALCFNAAVSLYLIRGWLETSYIKITKSPYRASKTSFFRMTTLSVMLVTIFLSVSRIVALLYYYHAPLEVAFKFEMIELPRLLNVTGYIPERARPLENYERDDLDLSPLKLFGLRLCVGKEWYRFPSHYMVPDGIRVDWVKSEFDGLLPGHFVDDKEAGRAEGLWWRNGTRAIPDGMNDFNREEPMHYVPVESCHYMLDLDFPEHPIEAPHEPRYAVQSDTWERVYCAPFLDARHSPLLTRTLWLPGGIWRDANSYGDYCLLKHKNNMAEKELNMIQSHTKKP